MTLHKPRDPETIPGAVAKIIQALSPTGEFKDGLPVVAKIVDRSPDAVRSWADPDKPTSPPMELGLLLDAEYTRRTGLQGPLWELYGKRLSEMTTGVGGMARYDLMQELLNAHVAAGAVTQAVRDAIHPNSPGGSRIVPVELARVSQAVDALDDAGERVMAAARQSVGA